MSIIFQLFAAEDLQKFDKDELIKLRDEILAGLRNRLAFKREEGKIHLNLREKVGPNHETPSGLNPQPPWVQEALSKRFYEVSHQLKTPPLRPVDSHPLTFRRLLTNEIAQTQEKKN